MESKYYIYASGCYEASADSEDEAIDKATKLADILEEEVIVLKRIIVISPNKTILEERG